MLNEEWLRTFAALGVVENGDGQTVGWRPVGACVFVGAHESTWLATASHVVPAGDAPRVALRLDIAGQPQLLALGMLQLQVPGIGWVRDEKNDLAACLLPNLPKVCIKAIPEQFWAPREMELTAKPCLIGGCPLGLPGLDAMRAMPVVLNGIVAGVDRLQKRLYVTAPTYPGNSGGPVFVDPGACDERGNVVVGGPTALLGGIVLSTNTVEAAGYERPLHLGVASHVQQLADLLAAEPAREQVKIARRSR